MLNSKQSFQKYGLDHKPVHSHSFGRAKSSNTPTRTFSMYTSTLYTNLCTIRLSTVRLHGAMFQGSVLLLPILERTLTFITSSQLINLLQGERERGRERTRERGTCYEKTTTCGSVYLQETTQKLCTHKHMSVKVHLFFPWATCCKHRTRVGNETVT